LGLKDFTPPYLAPTTAGHVVLQGVNYASGGGGILNTTGTIFVSFFFFFVSLFFFFGNSIIDLAILISSSMECVDQRYPIQS